MKYDCHSHGFHVSSFHLITVLGSSISCTVTSKSGICKIKCTNLIKKKLKKGGGSGSRSNSAPPSALTKDKWGDMLI